MPPKDAINALEVVLRDLITETLAEALGAEWIDQCGTPERIQKWRNAQAEDAKRRDGVVPEDRLIYYSDFPDLRGIIDKYWPHFKACFGDKKAFDVYMERLEEFRNPEMHSRELVPFEQSLVDGMTGELRNKVTLYRGSKDVNLDRHFARVEHIRDSFGHSVSTDEPLGMTLTDLVLRPGDEVLFDCVAWDPESRPGKWKAIIVNTIVAEATGLSARLRWVVRDEDIGLSCSIRIEFTADRSQHRFGQYDGLLYFSYNVLPLD